MIIKIEQFSLMIESDENENENEKENKMNMNMNGSNLCKDMFQLIKKLIVLYPVSFLSAIVTIIVITIAISI